MMLDGGVLNIQSGVHLTLSSACVYLMEVWFFLMVLQNKLEVHVSVCDRAKI